MSDSLYLDEIEKINYYKQKIVDQYLEKGMIIDKNKLQSKLDDIDMKLSIFKQDYIENGETLDIEKFNTQKHDIYRDLCILYKVAYKIAQEKLTAIERRINCEIEDLNEIAKRYQNRTALESLSIYGDSVYYETNGFDQEYKDGNVIITLGQISIPSGSYVACIFDCDETNDSDIIFKLDDEYQTANYNYSKRYLKMAGNYNINLYELNKEEESLTAFNIALDNINQKSSYNLFAGKDKIKLTKSANSSCSYVEKVQNIPLSLDEDSDISFYVYGASTIEFNYAGEYTYKSFDGYNISAPKYRQKIFISANKGFTFDIVTDGIIYADKEVCTASETMLTCPVGYKDIYDFTIEEIAYGDDVIFDNVQVIAKNATTTFYDINYIAIKTAQISELDGDIE